MEIFVLPDSPILFRLFRVSKSSFLLDIISFSQATIDDAVICVIAPPDDVWNQLVLS